MGSMLQFMFSKREGKGGQSLPYSRWDILLSVILGTALMVAAAYSAEPQGGWSLKRSLLVGATVVFAVCAAQNRKVALGCAFSLVAIRMGIGVISGIHPIVFITGAVVAGCAAWLLLHDLD